MRNTIFLITLFIVLITSCNSEKLLFEKETWWFGHWQNLEDPSFYLSIGQKPVGGNEIVTTQFFISTLDSIHSNFHVRNLIDFNHKQQWKIMETSDNRFIEIEEIDQFHIEVAGPVNSMEELDAEIVDYRRVPDDAPSPIPDSILFAF